MLFTLSVPSGNFAARTVTLTPFTPHTSSFFVFTLVWCVCSGGGHLFFRSRCKTKTTVFQLKKKKVYRLDSRWRYLRATTYFEFSDFADLHRRLKAAMKDTKFYKMMPSLPQRPADPRGRRLGSIDHARQVTTQTTFRRLNTVTIG